MMAYTDDARLIVRHPMGPPITAGCDTAWIQTRVSVVTPLALRCSALDRCATRMKVLLLGFCDNYTYHDMFVTPTPWHLATFYAEK